MQRVRDFAVSHISYVLIRRIAVLLTYMRPIVINLVESSVGLSAGLSISHASEPCKKPEAIELSFGFRTRVDPRNHVLHRVHITPREGAILRGIRANHRKVYGHSAVICAKTAKPIELPFRLWACMGPRNHVLDGGPMESANSGGVGTPVVKYRHFLLRSVQNG